MNNIQINTVTQYVEAQSEPDNNRYVFAYSITITNLGDQQAQLLTRHWWITDAEGVVREVQGEGVVGEQPKLQPQQSYRYTSGAILETPVGTMHGHYGFVAADGVAFKAAIPVFSLSVPNLIH